MSTYEEDSSAVSNWLVVMTAVGIIITASVLLFDVLFQPDEHRIDQIEVVGSSGQLDAVALEAAVWDSVGGNYFSVDMSTVLDVSKEFEWVKDVSVRRKWPSTLVVLVQEHQPVAKWGEAYWLTAELDLVTLPVFKSTALPRLKGPINTEKTVWRHYVQWQQQFGLQLFDLEKLEKTKEGLWHLAVKTDEALAREAAFTMTLSEENAEQQVGVFLNTALAELTGVIDRVKTVDLRYPSGFAIAWRAEKEDNTQQIL